MNQAVVGLAGLSWPAYAAGQRDHGSVVALGALIFVLTLGSPIIGLLLGAGSREAAPVMAILLVGAVGESMGASRQVLKYQGFGRSVEMGADVTILTKAARL